MGSIKSKFNKEEYDGLIKNTNYSGALNYLQGLYNETDDISEKDALQPFISNLRQKVHRDESYLRYAENDDVKQQYYFLDAIKNGTTIEGNSYYDTYSKALNNLGDIRNSDGSVDKANQLEFTFSSEKAYNTFLNNINMSEKEFSQLGVLIGNNAYGKTIHVNKSNPQFYNIINTIGGTQTQINAETIAYLNQFGALDPLAKLFQASRQENKDKILYRAFNNKGEAISNTTAIRDDESFQTTMRSINSMINKAQTSYNNLESLANNDLVVSSFSLPWATPSHMEAEEALEITGDQKGYDDTIKRINGQLTGAIQGLTLSQHNVYLSTSENPNFTKLTLEQAHEYDKYLKLALEEGRLGTTENPLAGVHMMMYGDKFGYEFKINPYANQKGVTPDEKQYISLFVENPWPTESSTKAFEARPEYRAMKEFILMNMYKYGYDFNDGSKITVNSEYGGVLRNKDGVEEFRSREEILNILNEQFIKEDDIRKLKYKYNNPTIRKTVEVGNFKTTEDSDAWTLALKSAKKLVNPANQKEYLHKAYDLYQSILNGAGYNGDRAVTLKDLTGE